MITLIIIGGTVNVRSGTWAQVFQPPPQFDSLLRFPFIDDQLPLEGAFRDPIEE